jgi:hypothetical protein
MLDWLLRLVGARGASQADAEPTEESASARPPPGQHWVYVAAPDCDVSSLVRSIDGVLKVTRNKQGYWRIAANQDVAAQVGRQIVSKGGSLTTLVTFETLTEFGARR